MSDFPAQRAPNFIAAEVAGARMRTPPAIEIILVDDGAPEQASSAAGGRDRRAGDDLRIVHQAGRAAGPDLGRAARQALGFAKRAKVNPIFAGRRHIGYLKPHVRAAFVRRTGLAYDASVRIGE